jgi:hypothetical protein
MTDQLSFFDVLAQPQALLDYEHFKEANPWVLPKLVEMCHNLKNNGIKRYGIAGLFEALRYQHALIDDPASDFKLNNNYRAFAARDIMLMNPTLDGFFETRRSVADLSEGY